MKWRDWILAALLLLVLLGQHVRLRQAEAQLATLTDCCQRQELKLKDLENTLEPLLRTEPEEPTYEELARKVFGYFDDHDVSGLLEDD